MNLQQLFVDYRKQRGLSLREAAKRIGISHSTLGRFEKGKELKTEQFAKIMTWLFQ